MRVALPLLAFALVLSACDGSDRLLAPDPAISRQAGPRPSESVMSIEALAASGYTGIPFGATGLFTDQATLRWGPAPFTSSNNYTQPSTIVLQLGSAATLGHKLILNMTGGSHERYKTAGKFDFAKWKAVMNGYDTQSIKDAVRTAVDDGVIIMNSVMDEPQLTSWGGNVNKPLVDSMATYVKGMFPTLPLGTVARWDWRPDERYQVIDAILAQYQWNKGDVVAYRDNVLARARVEGISVVFSINVLDGGIYSWVTKDCPIPLTGGFGTYSPACKMTPDQVRIWGSTLAVAGCAMNVWKFDQAFVEKPENLQAFNQIAAAAAGVPGPPCRRTSGSPPPPPANIPPVAAFAAPGCVEGEPCEFTDGSTDTDGTIASRQWEFGDAGSSADANPSHTYAEAGTFSVTLTVTDDDGGTHAVTKNVTVTAPAPPAPSAAFTAPSCTAGKSCQFTDASTDPGSTITGWNWTFGDGGVSTARSPTRTYAAAGTYTVTLTITYAGGTDQHSAPVTVTAAPPPTPITLTVTGRKDATKQYMTLKWTGATGTTVDVHRDGKFLINTPNDGQYTNSRNLPGSSSYTYKVCLQGKTTCSPQVTVRF